MAGGRRAFLAVINGARCRGAATRAARRHRPTGRLGQGPSGAPSIPGAWGHSGARVQRVGREPHVSREQEGEEGRKEKGKKEKGEKEKEKREKEEKGEKEKEAPAGFAAPVACRAWR